MFESLTSAPADAILKLIAEHRDDPRDNKIDLGVGVYRTAEGHTPVLDVVKEAERRLLETQDTKAYVGVPGDPGFNAAMQALAFGDNADNDRLVTLQTPGGSGSLRVAAGLILRARERATVWVSDPTWANHVPLLGGAGLDLKPYAYYDNATHQVRIDAMLDTLSNASEGDAVLLHACCHNPSGIDPTPEQWQQISDVIVERKLLPFVDMAYQGFAEGLDADAYIVRLLADRVPEMLLSASCSKNFGLYRDRVGSLSILASNRESRDVIASQANSLVRTIYSMPPDHGGAVVSMILHDAELNQRWVGELDAMRERLSSMGTLLVDALADKAPGADFSHLTRARGMFCFLGVTEEQVERLKKDFGVYMV
ncbi:MAG: amino acid aminotransferase, partial [Pseudomonadota bacterium]